MLKVDLHAHSSLQPFGNSFREKYTRSSKRKSSIWYNGGSNRFFYRFGRLMGLSFVSQSNFTSAKKGNVRVMCVSMYVPEISLIKNKLPKSFGNGLDSTVMRYYTDRMPEIESRSYHYFSELKKQYDFILNEADKKIAEGDNRYRVVSSFGDLKSGLSSSETDIQVVLNIEGAHAFGCGYPDMLNNPLTDYRKAVILKNIEEVKNWKHPVLYITLCHHYYNQICGHSKSLPASYNEMASQDFGLNFPISDFGFKVIEHLLDDTLGRRILIDIKHMSIAGRQHYFEYVDELKTKKDTYIPVLCSHGSPNGRSTYGTQESDTKNKILNPKDEGLFDHEIISIAQSGGIIGLNMDQRMMTSAANLQCIQKLSFIYSKRRKRQLWSGVIWENIKYIAELLNSKGIAPWDYIALGTDFDGAINPVSCFEQENDLESFAKCLKRHVEAYLNSTQCRLQLKYQIKADQIIEKLMHQNALHFMEANLD